MYRILIVEDDTIIAEKIANHLKIWNHDVRIVTDFQHVLKDFAEFDPHLVLLDITLPFYNGYTGVRKSARSRKIRFSLFPLPPTT